MAPKGYVYSMIVQQILVCRSLSLCMYFCEGAFCEQVHLSVCLFFSLSTGSSLNVHLCACASLRTCLFLSFSLYLSLSSFLSLCRCISFSKCISESACISLWGHLFLQVCLCILYTGSLLLLVCVSLNLHVFLFVGSFLSLYRCINFQ